MKKSIVDRSKDVQNYYGEVLQGTGDLKTSACCTSIEYPQDIKKIMSSIHDEVLSRYYGCGLVIPNYLDGCDVLDLGAGAGRDCYIISKLVGEDGTVTGVDMTANQLEVARRHKDFHADVFGHKKSNVEFLEGNIEDLRSLGIKNQSFDAIVSNCVINLTNDKQAVFDSAYRTLKYGGELYFADVYTDRRVNSDLINDPVLYGECLSGALYWNDFIDMAKAAGFQDTRVVDFREIEITDQKIKELVGDIRFYSVTSRLFKIESLESNCEDYGQAVKYIGGIKNSEKEFIFDSQHIFKAGKVEQVCRNSYDIIHGSRFEKYFEYYGDTKNHFGPFDCGRNSIPFINNESNTKSCL